MFKFGKINLNKNTKSMKKFSFLLAALTFSIGFGQISVTATSNGGSINVVSNVNEVLVDQPADGTNGIISTNLLDLGGAVYVADDFELTKNSKITKLTAYGFNNAGNFMVDATGVSFYIIEDEDWFPAGSDPSIDALHKFDLNIGDPGLVITVDGGSVALTLDLTALDTDVVLSANKKYWLSVVPAMDNTGGDGALRWNWYESVTPEGVEAHLLDPADLFGSGYTAWTGLTSISGITWQAQAMTIEGEEAVMGVSDLNASSFVVYPNPATNLVKVDLKNADVKDMVVLNLAGQIVAKSNTKSVNVSTLPAGVYVVKVIDTKGATHTSKIVKK